MRKCTRLCYLLIGLTGAFLISVFALGIVLVNSSTIQNSPTKIIPGPRGPQGPQGIKGRTGIRGEKGVLGIDPKQVNALDQRIQSLQEKLDNIDVLQQEREIITNQLGKLWTNFVESDIEDFKKNMDKSIKEVLEIETP